MKLLFVLGISFVLAVLMQTAAKAEEAEPAPVAAESDGQAAPVALANLTRMEVCGEVKRLQPVDAGTAFAADREKVYCYLEFGKGRSDTSVTVIWIYNAQEIGRENLLVRRFPLFRTWSNRTISGMKGDWNVYVLDEQGTFLKSLAFTVQ